MITAQQVKELREKTGAGMMDCKIALQKAEGDFAKAEKFLKEQGIIAASKRSGRATNEGRIFTEVGENTAVILEIACETDFVARNEQFITQGNKLAKIIADGNTDTKQLEAMLVEVASLIKENLQLKRFDVLNIDANSLCATYIHGDAGNIGALVKLQADSPIESQEIKDFAFDCALHAAAFRPLYLSSETIPKDYIEEQRNIFMVQAKKLDKPENILAGIVEGKLRKHYNEICLLEQPFVKDDKVSVQAKMKEVIKNTVPFSIAEYRVFSVGEE